MGNGVCDNVNNNAICDFDGDDCFDYLGDKCNSDIDCEGKAAMLFCHMNHEYIASVGDAACGIANCDHTTDKFNITDNCCTNKENFACFGADDCCTSNLYAHGFKVS